MSFTQPAGDGYFFFSAFSSSSFSVLPFLMTSGSAGAVGAATASAATATSSTFGAHDVDDHHVGVADRLPLGAFGLQVADAQRPGCSISSVMSTVDVLRDVARQHLDLDLAVHEVDDAALLLDALRLRPSARPGR